MIWVYDVTQNQLEPPEPNPEDEDLTWWVLKLLRIVQNI